MNFDRLADDLWNEFRKVKTETRYGCSDDGGVLTIHVREGDRSFELYQEDESIRVVERFGITTTSRTFTDRERVMVWMLARVGRQP